MLYTKVEGHDPGSRLMETGMITEKPDPPLVYSIKFYLAYNRIFTETGSPTNYYYRPR